MNAQTQDQPVNTLRDKPLYVQAYDEIRAAILSGRFPPGARLNQSEMSHRLGVSRAPVLDALTRLATQGLVDQRPRRGYFVKTFTTKEVSDLYNVRAALECQAFAEACDRVTPSDLAELRASHDQARADLAKGDFEPYFLADAHFHARLIEISGNSIIEELMMSLRDRIQLVRVMVAVSIERVRRAASEHEKILSCLERRDKDQGRRVMLHHIESVKHEVVRQLS